MRVRACVRAVRRFATADAADFCAAPPEALPAEHLEAAMGEGAAGRWVRVARRPGLRPEGRLVVPREEWVTLEAGTHPLLQFWLSLLPWAVPPPRARRRAE